MIEGLRALRAETTGRFDLEVFIARGINDAPDHLAALAALARSLDPDSIQLNTAVRPVPGLRDLAVDRADLESFLPLFGPDAEIIASFETSDSGRGVVDVSAVLEVLQRRPCTAAEIASSLQVDEDSVNEALRKLEHLGHVTRAGDTEHWLVSPDPEGDGAG